MRKLRSGWESGRRAPDSKESFAQLGNSFPDSLIGAALTEVWGKRIPRGARRTGAAIGQDFSEDHRYRSRSSAWGIILGCEVASASIVAKTKRRSGFPKLHADRAVMQSLREPVRLASRKPR